MKHRLVSFGFTLLLAVSIVGGCALLLKRWTPARVAGGSMQPALHAGDIVIADRGLDPSRGQIALAWTERHGRFVHRIAEIRPDGRLEMKGDANPVPDIESLSREAVIGPVVAVVPVGRWLGR